MRRERGKLLRVRRPSPKTFLASQAAPWRGGGAFLRDEASRSIFAEALGLDLVWLDQLLDRAKTHRYLVLDPTLPLAVTEYLKAREETIPGRYSCVVVSLDGVGERHRLTPEVLRSALREAALGCERPIVVLARGDTHDAHFYQGAEIETTTVVAQHRGWTLAALPEFIPTPPPAPALLETEAGYPLLPCPQLTEPIRQGTRVTSERDDWGKEKHHVEIRDYKLPEALKLDVSEVRRLAVVIHMADRAGREPSLELESVVPYLLDRQPLSTVQRTPSLHGTTEAQFELAMGTSPQTWWWTTSTTEHPRRFANLFVVGPEREPFATMIQPHSIAEPATFDAFRTFVRSRNPLHFARSAWAAEWLELCAQIRAETGLDLTGSVRLWRDPVDQGMAPGRRCVVRPEHQADAELTARERFTALLAREFDLTPADSRRWFELRAMANAPWVLLPTEEGEVMHFVANLGAGHLVRLRAVSFPGEPPEPIRCFDREQELRVRAAAERGARNAMATGYSQIDHAAQEAETTWAAKKAWFELDGGDIHLWIETMYTPLLEGSGLPVGPRRRRETEAGSSQDDD